MAQQGPAAVMPDQETEVVPNGRRAYSYNNDVRQTQIVLGVGKETGKQKNSFAGKRQAGVL